MPQIIDILCAGASQGLITRAAPLLLEQLDVTTRGRFGAVGVMKDAFMAGEPCDLMVLTEQMVRAMVAAGELRGSEMAALGVVYTGLAVPEGRPLPKVDSPESLAAAFRAASSIWLPDVERSTAGLHAMKVLRELGVAEKLSPRIRIFPNGATAMREMAAAADPGAIGCTQVSEILFTPRVTLVGKLPKTFELGTIYSAAVSARSSRAQLTGEVIALLSGPQAGELRVACGLE
jgi:molybdate transport system substrate-binding protein